MKQVTIIAVAALAFAASLAAQIPDKPWGYVTDTTGTLSESEISALNAKLGDFEKESTHQIFVLIAPSLEGKDVFTETFETAERWGIGREGKDNGVLVALYLNDRKLRIEVGYGLEGAIPDAFANRVIQETMVPRLKDGEVYYAVFAATDRLIAVTRGEEIVTTEDFTDESPEVRSSPLAGWMMTITGGIYGMLSLIYAWLFGRTPQRGTDGTISGTSFSFDRASTEFLANHGVALFAGGVPGFFLYFILQEFGVDGMWAVSVILILAILIYLGALGGSRKEHKAKIRALLDNHKSWEKLKQRFDPAQVARMRRTFEADMNAGGLYLSSYYGNLEKDVQRTLKEPETMLVYRADYSLGKSKEILDDTQFWEDASAVYEPQSVQKLLADSTAAYGVLMGNADAERADALYKKLRKHKTAPADHFDYSRETCRERIEEFLDTEKRWLKWMSNADYSKSKVKNKRKELRDDWQDLLAQPPEKPETLSAINDFYKKTIRAIDANPAAYFKKPRPVSTSTSTHSSTGSWSSSSYSSSSSSWSSGGSSFSGGGGGSFGGGGASGSW